MTRYMIVNPSDPYTIDAPDLEVATVACIMLGRGQYAFEPIGGGEEVPVMMFGVPDEWFQQKFGSVMEVVMHRVRHERTEELAACMDSCLIGSDPSREAFDAFIRLRSLSGHSVESSRMKWHDEKRSSMNDIGGRAWAYAKALRDFGKPPAPAPQQVLLV